MFVSNLELETSDLRKGVTLMIFSFNIFSLSETVTYSKCLGLYCLLKVILKQCVILCIKTILRCNRTRVWVLIYFCRRERCWMLIFRCEIMRIGDPKKWKTKKNTRAFRSPIFLSRNFVESVAWWLVMHKWDTNPHNVRPSEPGLFVVNITVTYVRTYARPIGAHNSIIRRYHMMIETNKLIHSRRAKASL